MNNVSNPRVIIWDESSSTRNRVKTILEKLNISVYEASNSIELFNVMADLKNRPDAIIMDIGIDIGIGFGVLANIKEINRKIPIIILTSNNQTHVFTRGILEGASDYLLKPFEDVVIIEKVLKCLHKTNENEVVTEVLFDILGYLNTELKKAVKGKYEVTVIMCTFFIPVKGFNIQIEKNSLSEYLYVNMKSVLWETDIFVKYGSQTFLGVFPFCGLESRMILKNKFVEKFAALKAENSHLAKYHFVISTVSFPSDSENAQEVLTKLNDSMKKSIEDIKEALTV